MMRNKSFRRLNSRAPKRMKHNICFCCWEKIYMYIFTQYMHRFKSKYIHSICIDINLIRTWARAGPQAQAWASCPSALLLQALGPRQGFHYMDIFAYVYINIIFYYLLVSCTLSGCIVLVHTMLFYNYVLHYSISQFFSRISLKITSKYGFISI